MRSVRLVHTQIKTIPLNVRLAILGLGVGLEYLNVIHVQHVFQDIKYVLIVLLLMIDSARSAPQELTKLEIILLHVLPVQLVPHGALKELLNVQIVRYVSQVTTKA